MFNKFNQQAKKPITIIAFVASFIYFGFFRFWMIPSGDDYFWWGNQGTYLLYHGFYGPQATYGGSSNGRYFGNLLEIITMHRLTLAVLAYAIGWTLLIWCIWKLSGKTIASLLLSPLFVFTLQGGFINNVLAWNAGFVNYVPPMILVLLYLIVLEWDIPSKVKPFIPILTLLLAFSAGLFDENMTIPSVILAILVILYYRKKTKALHITYLIGAILSAVIMFIHRGYHEASIYRVTTFNPNKIWQDYGTVTHFWLVTFNIALIVAILLAIFSLTVKSNLPVIRKWLTAIVAAIFLVYYIFINIYLKTIPLNDGYSYNALDPKLWNREGIISVIFILFIAYAIFTFFKTDPKMWLYVLLIGAIAGQLLFVESPVNPRGYFLTYIFMYLIAMKFVLKALDAIKVNQYVINLALLLALIFMGGNYQIKVHTNYVANLERVNHPQFYKRGVLFSKHIPYREFVWTNDLTNQQSPAYWNLYLTKHHLIKN